MRGSLFVLPAVAAAMVGGLLGTPSAAAASAAIPTPSPPTPTPGQVSPGLKLPSGVTAQSVVPSSVAAAAAAPGSVQAVNPAQGLPPITCTGHIETPFESAITGGRVLSTSDVSCDGPAEISMGVELFYDGVIPVGLPGVAFGDTTFATATAETLNCTNGTYVAAMLAFVTFPPGYTPLTSPIQGAVSSPATITCT